MTNFKTSEIPLIFSLINWDAKCEISSGGDYHNKIKHCYECYTSCCMSFSAPLLR